MRMREGGRSGATGGGLGNVLRIGALGLALAAVSACSSQIRHHGYAPSERELAQIQVGRDTRDTVAEALGHPASSGLMQDSGWYYVASSRRHFAFRAPEEIDREVVAVSFDQRGTVTNIERFGLEDGQVVALSRRVTDTQIRGTTLIQQLFRNLGRFTPGQFF